MSKRLLTALAAGVLLAASVAGCGGAGERSGNNAAAVGANAAYTPAPGAGDARPLNANITREEFERDRGYYEQEARRLRRTVGPEADDLWVWWKTRSALYDAEDVRELTIDVDVENGVVTLSGTVRNAAQKEKAGQVARGVGGVKDVRNNLTVGQL
jgi:hyperosmotically inducible protein